MTKPLRPAEQPITEGDDFIAEALESASIPTLMMSIIHITGDASLLRGAIRPAAINMADHQAGITEEEKATVRRLALDALRDYRDRGCTLPPPPSHETVLEMMSFVVGQEVPASYVPMMLEEMALDGEDTREVDWAAVPEAAKKGFRVLVIGAGMSGLLTAIRLQDAGIPYLVVEKNDRVGGTWYENSYPGCRVDVSNHFYCYSFEPNPDWSEYFAQRDELHDYFERCATRYGVRPHIRFDTEVVAARWDESSRRWKVGLRQKDGEEEAHEFNAIVSAVGQLNRPSIPAVKGLDSFEGPKFHSAEWRHDVSLEGKRVAVIGTGASAFQLVPEVAKIAGKLSVFQRSPAWMFPNFNYHRKVSEGKKWLLKHVPFYGRWYRFVLFWPGSDGLMPSLIVDPDWPHPERSVNAQNEQTRIMFTEFMKSQVGDDPELLEKVVPTYPPFVKRILQDSGSWLQTLKRENVELVTDPIAELTTDAIVGESGERYEVDVIVFATGFHANRFLWPIEIVGREGVPLGELWGDDPQAHLGISVPGFPNLFCLYGPGTNLAHAGSIIFHSECQVRYIMGCLEALLEHGHGAMECKREVCDAYNEKLQATANKTVWAHPGARSWYKNSEGHVTTVSPFLLRDYWSWTREPNLADFEFS